MMDIVLTYGLAFLIGWPLGLYMSKVFKGERTFADPVLNPLERGLFRLLGVDEPKACLGKPTPRRCSSPTFSSLWLLTSC